jgi:hypothetical protein
MIVAAEIETKLIDFLKREVFAPDVVVTPETDLVAAGFDSFIDSRCAGDQIPAAAIVGRHQF